MTTPTDYWRNVYSTRSPTELGWYEALVLTLLVGHSVRADLTVCAGRST
jgi:hypothetical protein